MSLKALFLSSAVVAASAAAWAQTMPGGGGGGVPQPVVNGECVIGAGGVAVWGSCSGAGTSVTSVTNSDGTLTISPTTGAVVASLALAHANTWTAAQTFNNSDIKLLGSSTGATTLTSANAGVSNFTLTLPAVTDTLAVLGANQTFTGANNYGTPSAINLTNGTALPLTGLAAQAADTVVMNATAGSASPTAVSFPACAADGSHAITYASHTLGCTVVTGGGGSVSLTSTSAALIATPSPITGTGTFGLTNPINAQVGTSYTIVSGDATKTVTTSNASAIAVTLPQATGSFGSGFGYNEYNYATGGTATITPTTSTIAGKTTLALAAHQGASIFSDGTNYGVILGLPEIAADNLLLNATGSTNYPTAAALTSCSAASSALTYNTTSHAFGCNTISGSGTVNSGTSGQLAYYASTGTAVSGTNAGTGVIAALGNNLSAAGGVTSTIASGTSALGTSAIASGACATVVTTAATNVVTTDVIQAGFNGDPTGVTGYAPAASGMLTIISYPTANNVNFKVCNNTSSSITPGAITLNWRVAR